MKPIKNGSGKMVDSFLEQVAKDYDLPYHIVEAIYKRADGDDSC